MATDPNYIPVINLDIAPGSNMDVDETFRRAVTVSHASTALFVIVDMTDIFMLLFTVVLQTCLFDKKMLLFVYIFESSSIELLINIFFPVVLFILDRIHTIVNRKKVG